MNMLIAENSFDVVHEHFKLVTAEIILVILSKKLPLLAIKYIYTHIQLFGGGV